MIMPCLLGIQLRFGSGIMRPLKEAWMEPSTYAARREVLRAAVSDGAILIMGNDEAPRNYVDNVYPFRQDSHFLYYGGVSHPGLALLIEPDGRAVIYGAPGDRDDVIWHGPHPSLADHAAAAGAAEHADIGSLAERISALRGAGVDLHYLPPYRAQRRFALARLLGADPREVGAQTSVALVRAVVAQRSVKEEREIDEIEDALSVTAGMYGATLRATRAGRTEAEIAAVHVAEAISAGCGQAFGPIVTVHGEVLHNVSYDNTLSEGDLLLVDSGAEAPSGYASDITRAFPVSGRFTTQQREIYDVVLAANQAAVQAAAPGVSNRELHLLASRTVASGLKDLGLMQGDVDAAVEAGAHALFFVHGLGHMMGLDVHDMEDLGDVVGYEPGEERSTQFGLAYLRLARTLESGYVITIEPGIYFIPALIDRWQADGLHRDFIRYDAVEQYRSFGGIRIEDDVLITESGSRVLGPPIPKTVAEIEAAMAK
jgi:Xaa-Pro aminopeptidase